MPRLLPRLLKALQEAPLTPSTSKRVAGSRNVGACKRKSLYRPIPVSLPSFHPAGRMRSILLEENPVTDKRVFTRHKRLPPRVRLGPRPVGHDEHDVPREMTTREREWWSSPYLRMLATPLRQCTLSKRYLPNDFLVRLAVLRLPATQDAPSMEVLMPDGLEHPKYKRRKARVAMYVPCWKEAVETMKSPVSLPRYSANIFVSKHLCAHISYLLRLRVLQELEVLIDTLKGSRGRVKFDAAADATILRRLTRSEFKTFRQTGIIPYPDAVAVLVVPPVNRDPRTNMRPRPSQEPEIPSSESHASADTMHKKALPPLSSLHCVSTPEGALEQDTLEIPFSTFMPNARVPWYNGLAMFPSPLHRATFHKSLTELLDVERHFRGTRPTLEVGTTSTEEPGRAKGDTKGSHAFLFVSNEETVKRGDTAALAVALWRLRMWEGDAFADQVEGWEVGKEWRIEQSNRL
ncbi:hypothetical protein OG21DRAFT_1503806 [Imleria badia]|nr:hypothetical protein OG21DRAFT_1503806 [Imleria badia]